MNPKRKDSLELVTLQVKCWYMFVSWYTCVCTWSHACIGRHRANEDTEEYNGVTS